MRGNQRGYVQIIAIIVLLIIILFLFNIISINNGELKFPLFQKEYFAYIDYQEKISPNEDIEFEIYYKNPTNENLNLNLVIEYDNDKWKTYNRYIRLNEEIPFEAVPPKNIQKYSIKFESNRYVNNQNYTFNFSFYGGNHKLLENISKNVQVE
ncbi:hypothetical protein H6501_04175 [Candidatus Woesearchaeota archaeon]|nr:hypothetical protein [Nanoarchaeota archaeon]MCB9370769.1 hypothetical protein [Candidatus Woesearchaeota archaeon]USN43845.1 MAG: hypothetical protein H6500_05650 [Candidatus Woesearchaeota archaeon]